MVRTIYGGEVKCPVGYCRLHDGALTVKQLRKKDCEEKQCWHFQRNDEHPWWEQREAFPQFR